MARTAKKKKKSTYFVENHPTKLITIKSAKVDVKMVPVINWMNKYESVNTLFCCQGDDRQKQPPYILWTCSDTSEFIQILSMLKFRSKTEAHWKDFKGQLEYYTYFSKEVDFDEFVEYLIAKIKKEKS